MVQRKQNMEKLIKLKDKKIIKALTGIRRCGKSTLLLMFRDFLKESGIEEKQIISANFENLASEPLLEYRKLHEYITARIQPDKMTYVFPDEIQNVPEFQKAVDSLFIKDNVDFYITGSNAQMLSGELATLLSGRYIEIRMLEKAGRYDVKGKLHLKSLEKYYLADMGLRRMLLGDKGADIGHILENIVYLELLRRGYTVDIGKVGDKEIDFVAMAGGDEREIDPLKSVSDHYPKFILSMDELPVSEDGIRQVNIVDFYWKNKPVHCPCIAIFN